MLNLIVFTVSLGCSIPWHRAAFSLPNTEVKRGRIVEKDHVGFMWPINVALSKRKEHS
jgi:hypothetical protein